MRFRLCCLLAVSVAAAALIVFAVFNVVAIGQTYLSDCANLRFENPLRTAGCATGWDEAQPGALLCYSLLHYIETPGEFEDIVAYDSNVTGLDVYDGLVKYYNRSCDHTSALATTKESRYFFLTPALLYAWHFCEDFEEESITLRHMGYVQWCVNEIAYSEYTRRL